MSELGVCVFLLAQMEPGGKAISEHDQKLAKKSVLKRQTGKKKAQNLSKDCDASLKSSLKKVKTSEKESFDPNWSHFYHLKNGFIAERTPEYVRFNNSFAGSGIHMHNSIYNGIRVNLHLTKEMTQAQFEEELRRSGLWNPAQKRAFSKKKTQNQNNSSALKRSPINREEKLKNTENEAKDLLIKTKMGSSLEKLSENQIEFLENKIKHLVLKEKNFTAQEYDNQYLAMALLKKLATNNQDREPTPEELFEALDKFPIKTSNHRYYYPQLIPKVVIELFREGYYFKITSYPF